MTKAEMAVIQRTALTRVIASQADVFTEFYARYLDGASHALIDEMQQRTREAVELLMPVAADFSEVGTSPALPTPASIPCT